MSTPTALSGAEHQALQDLLPWYASGALDQAEAQRVQDHLPGCAACRADLAWQRKLLETEGPLPAGLDPERALARLMPRLGQAAGPLAERTPATALGASPQLTPPVPISPAGVPLSPPAPAVPAGPELSSPAPAWRDSPPLSPPSPAASRGWARRLRAWWDGAGWQGWAIGAQFAAIAVLAALQLLPRDEAPIYQALGRGAASTPDLLVVFKPDARLQDVQHILQANGAQIIGGPTVTGAYMLDVEASRQARLLAALRADPSVETAEALTAGTPP
ncbi:zf-HC2 domain-containing protein [Oxalobacteraceae bacterium A2-2]